MAEGCKWPPGALFAVLPIRMKHTSSGIASVPPDARRLVPAGVGRNGGPTPPRTAQALAGISLTGEALAVSPLALVDTFLYNLHRMCLAVLAALMAAFHDEHEKPRSGILLRERQPGEQRRYPCADLCGTTTSVARSAGAAHAGRHATRVAGVGAGLHP